MKNTLQNVRKKLKLNQEDFGAVIKKSRVHVSRMENDPLPPSHKVTLDIIKNINDHFGEGTVTIRDFYDYGPAYIQSSSTEKELLDTFRELDEPGQSFYLHMLKSYVTATPEPNPKKKNDKK